MNKRFEVLKENPCVVRDWGEQRNYNLQDGKQALSLCQLLNVMNDTLVNTLRPAKSVSQPDSDVPHHPV